MSATKDRFATYVLCLVAEILFGLTVPASKVATRRKSDVLTMRVEK